MRSYKVELPRGIEVDIFNLPEDFEGRVKQAFVRHAYAAEFLVTIEGADKATTLYYSQTGVWFDEQGEPYKVVAWMLLPERYKE